jgi:hypothetical protein
MQRSILLVVATVLFSLTEAIKIQASSQKLKFDQLFGGASQAVGNFVGGDAGNKVSNVGGILGGVAGAVQGKNAGSAAGLGLKALSSVIPEGKVSTILNNSSDDVASGVNQITSGNSLDGILNMANGVALESKAVTGGNQVSNQAQQPVVQ